MITATEEDTDVFQRGFGKVFGEIHGNLAGLYNFAFPCFGFYRFYRDVVEIANQFLDIIDRDFAGRVLYEILYDLLGKVEVELFASETGLGQQRDEGAFQFTYIGIDVVGKIFNYIAV